MRKRPVPPISPYQRATALGLPTAPLDPVHFGLVSDRSPGMFHPSQMCSHFRHGAKVIPVRGPYGHFTSLCNDPDFCDFGVAGLDLYTVLLRRKYDVPAALEALGGQIGEQTATFHLERRLLSLCDMLDRSLFFNERHAAALHAPARQLVKVAHSAIEGVGMGVVRCDLLVAVDVRRAARLHWHTSRLSMSLWTTWQKHNGSGGTTRHKAGYVMRRVPGHPRASARSPYVFEHILVMEEILGRYLLDGETVHHLNGVKDDNRSENLELWVRPQPTGIRVRDAIAWSREILARYGDGFETAPTTLTHL